MARKVESHGSVAIYHDEYGYHARNGCDRFGYADTLEEIRDEIDAYWEGSEHGELNGFFNARDDSPSLPSLPAA